MIRLVLFGFVVQQVSGVINRLTLEEYDKLPKLTQIDDYASCLRHPGDSYCYISSVLYGNRSDPIYNTLVEYSENTITHYDHTRIRRGICTKKTCAKHLNVSSNLTDVIEACLNESLTSDYRLTSKVVETWCQEYDKWVPWDLSDAAFGVGVLIILGLNIFGSLYDFYCHHGKDTFVGRFLLCFAVRRNWNRFVAPPSSNPMHRRVKVLNSFKTISSFLVIMAHSPLSSLVINDNPLYIEESYHKLPFHLLYNGTLLVQTFFVASGLLLAYNFLISEEKRRPSVMNLPKFLLLRWLRLTPVYAIMTFFMMTWSRHLGEGPFYQKALIEESNDCRRNWWLHMLYIYNYKDHTQCMAHAWYLAADFQLCFVGLLVFCLVHSTRCRKIAIGVVVFIGVLTPAIHTYVQDLHAVLIIAPEVALNFFVKDPTFNNLYKRGHTNLMCYGMGLAMAFVVYNLKESDLGAQKYKKYRILYYMLFPLMLVPVFLGSIFYVDDIVIPIAVRVVYSSAVKFYFGLLTLLFIFFTIVKIDSVFRGFLHWNGWTLITRISYFAYLVHVPLLRFIVANLDKTVTIGIIWFTTNYLAILSLSYLLAIPLFVSVEAPLAEVVKVVMLPAPKPEKVKAVSMDDIKCSKETIEVKL